MVKFDKCLTEIYQLFFKKSSETNRFLEIASTIILKAVGSQCRIKNDALKVPLSEEN